MRIGIIAGEFPPIPGGVGAYTAILARRLMQAGHEVCVLSSHGAHSPDIAVQDRLSNWGPSSMIAARRWANDRAIGGRFSLGFGPEMEVVGFVRDVRVDGLDRAVPPVIYLPSNQHAYNFMTLVVRTTSTPRNLLPTIRAIVRDVDAEQPIYNVRTMNELIARSVAERRFHMLLLAGFSTVALLLAVVGVHGVMSYLVEQRRGEIGIRMALGARPRDVSAGIVREAVLLALLATAIGVPLALAFTRLLAASLFGVRAADPWTYAATVAILVGTAVLAAYIPARRAAGVDPAVALRSE